MKCSEKRLNWNDPTDSESDPVVTVNFVPSRPVSSVHSTTTVVHNTSAFAGDQSQPIIISDTPSPAVSIITIHSDSEDEDDRKFPAAW